MKVTIKFLSEYFHDLTNNPNEEEYKILIVAKVNNTMESTINNTNQCGESKVSTAYEAFTSSQGQLLVGEQKYTIRILKMNGSTMVFLSATEPECLDEIAVAMKMPQDNQVIATSVVGPQIITDSQRMAEKLCKRFGRQFVVSYNVNVDRMTAPLLEKQLSEYIRTHEHQFV